MRRKLLSLSLIALTGVSLAVAVGAISGQKSLAMANTRADNNDWSITLDGSTNLLTDGAGSGVFNLHDTNTVAVSYSGYTQSSNNWGVLAKDGYFQITGRIGGLTSLNYHISSELTILFGYQKYSEPDCYNAPLVADVNSFNFPDGLGYPDTFKILNESENDITIQDITIFYTCSQEDQHVHHSLGVKSNLTRTTDPTVKYWDVCEICGDSFEVYLDKTITIDTSSENKYTYNAYSYVDYNTNDRGPGSLDIDYKGGYSSAQRFVLTLSGDNGDKDLYINANHDGGSQIIIMAEEGAKIGNITFKGGYGVLVFMGETLTFADGATLDSEAIYTTVKSPLVFNKTGEKTGNAIYVNNGSLVLENNVTISGYENGIKFNQSATGTKDLEQTGGTLNISNCTNGISGVGATYTPAVKILGTVNISGCKYGIRRASVMIGNNTTAGRLIISLDRAGSSQGDPTIGIYLSSQATLDFVKGVAAIYSTSTDSGFAIGIKSPDGGFANNSLYSCNQEFRLGFAKLSHGFSGENEKNIGFEFKENTFTSTTLLKVDVQDLGGYLVTKPGHTTVDYPTFNSTFGLNLA